MEGELNPMLKEKLTKIKFESRAEAQAENLEIVYINKFLKILDFEAKYMSTYSGKTAGATYRVKNTGPKTITRIDAIIYLKDRENNIIFEEKILVMNCDSAYTFSGNDNPLKPNYIHSFEKDKFRPIEKCPTEWKEGNASMKIVDIEFQP